MWSKPGTPRAFRWRRRRPWQRRPSVCSRKLNRPSFVSRWSSPAQTSSTSTAFVHPRPATTTMSSIHAEPPPPIVTEPTGINYATGPSLGKGGFAICHRAERYDGSRPTGHIVALKIVKTKMEPAKLAQKVYKICHHLFHNVKLADTAVSLFPSSRSTRNYRIQTSSHSIALSPSTPAHTLFWTCARMDHWPTC